MRNRTHTFNIEHKTEEGETLQGQFTYKRQSILDQSRIARRKSELSGGMYTVRDDEGNPTGQGIDEFTESFNYAIATLETCLIQKPNWWNLDEIADPDLVLKVFKEVQNFENSFRRRGRDKSEEQQVSSGSEGTSEEEYQASQSTDSSPKVVDGQVSTSLDA